MDPFRPLQPFTNGRNDSLVITHNYKSFILFDLDFITRVAFIVLLTKAWVLAMAGKYTIFRMIALTGIVDKPINVLILFDQVVDVITRSVHIPTVFVLVTSRPLADFIGKSICPVFTTTVFSGFAFRAFGPLSIAIFRIIYVKGNGYLVSNKNIEWIVCIVLLSSNIVTSSFLLFLYTLVTSPRSYLKEMCNGYNSEHLLILLEYTGALTQTWITRAILVVLTSAQVLIAVLYAILFWHIYKHDKTMEKVLSEQVIKNRKKRNAISCACEMYGYAVEVLMYTFFMLTASADQFRTLRSHAMILWQFEFAIKSTVQAMAGHDTRNIFLGILRKANIFRIHALK